MVDDAEEDIFFVQRALAKAGRDNLFRAVHSGNEAVAYLKGDGCFKNRNEYPFPNLMLCDLKMPGLDGYDLLRWLREHSECKVIPTVIFSSSSLDSDVQHCYVLGANAYVKKPNSLEEMSQALDALYRFWSICEVPPPPITERCG